MARWSSARLQPFHDPVPAVSLPGGVSRSFQVSGDVNTDEPEGFLAGARSGDGSAGRAQCWMIIRHGIEGD